jgi:hypothetical protein
MIQAEIVAQSELNIEMLKYAYVIFCGTSSQLVAEGLIPDGFEWPDKQYCRVEWTIGSYDYALMRCRPPGMKGKQSVWAQIDYWKLLFKPEDAQTRYSQRALLLNLLETRRLAAIDTPMWRRMINERTKALGRARNDEKFMAIFERLQGR